MQRRITERVGTFLFHHHCVRFIRFKFLPTWQIGDNVHFLHQNTPLLSFFYSRFFFIFFFYIGNFNRLQSFQLTLFSHSLFSASLACLALFCISFLYAVHPLCSRIANTTTNHENKMTMTRENFSHRFIRNIDSVEKKKKKEIRKTNMSQCHK